MLNGLAFGNYTCKTFLFEGRDCIIVFPDTSDENRNWIIKTEYWSAFPDTEKAFLKRGFHLLFMGNANRWATPEDCHARARFAKFVAEHYHLREK